MEKIALLPGGFKPPHAGHYNMAKWLAANTDADTVVVKVGAKEREGITRDQSLLMWEIYRSTDTDPVSNKLTILPSNAPSPVRDVYDFIEQEAPEGSIIYLAIGEKDSADKRYANISKFAEPRGIQFSTVEVPPQAGGVSGTEMRGFIKNGEKYQFQKYLPEHLSQENKDKIWTMLEGSIQEDLYNPEDHVLDYMKSSEWKAGMPDGPKDDETSPVIKYQRGGKYNAATGQGGAGTMYESLEGDKASKIFVMKSPHTPKGQKWDHIGFILNDGRLRDMSGHRGSDKAPETYKYEDTEELFQMPKDKNEAIKKGLYDEKPLPKEITIPDTIACNIKTKNKAENCGSFVKIVLSNNGIETTKSNWMGDIYNSLKEDHQTGEGNKKLRIYDFDDTLAVTRGANIRIKHADGSMDSLDPAAYAVYKPQPGDKFDFTEFDKIITDATPIQHIVDLLRSDVQDVSSKVTILTARLLAYPVRRYLKSLGLDVYVIAVGSSDPQEKVNWIEKNIKSGYDDITFVDDSPKNIAAVEALAAKYPEISLKVNHPDELSEMMGGTMNNQEKAKHEKNLKKLRQVTRKQGDQMIPVPDFIKGTLTRKLYELSDEEQEIVDDILSEFNTLNEFDFNKLKSYGKKGLLTLAILLSVASQAPAQNTQDIVDQGIEMVDRDYQKDFNSAMVGLAVKLSSKGSEKQFAGTHTGDRMEEMAVFKEIRHHYEAKRDGKKATELSPEAKKEAKIMIDLLIKELDKGGLDYYVDFGKNITSKDIYEKISVNEYEFNDYDVKQWATHADLYKKLSTPDAEETYSRLKNKLKMLMKIDPENISSHSQRLEALEYFYGYFKEDPTRELEEIEYGSQNLLQTYQDQIKEIDPQWYRNLQLMMSQKQDNEVDKEIRDALESGKLKYIGDLPKKDITIRPSLRGTSVDESKLFSQDWWLKQLKENILEAKANTHLTHLEELILTEGQDGYNKAKSFLLELIQNLKGHSNAKVNTSVKWDGAPAMFVGTHPENGKFFVGTKSVFNKEPKINYTKEDINQNHGHAPGLATKLKLALEYLPSLGIKNILQGDFMFSDSTVSTKDIDGVAHYIFRPNTITYAVEADSNLGQKISNAGLGIVFHTTYDDLKGNASFGADVSGLNKSDKVWFDDAWFDDDTGTVTITPEEAEEVLGKIKEADSIKVNYDGLPSVFLNTYINSEIRTGQFLEDPSKSYDTFLSWLQEKLNKKGEKLKSDKGKEKHRIKSEEEINNITSNKENIINVLRLSKTLSEAKSVFITKYNNAVYRTKHFVDDGAGGLKVTNPEGYVAVDHIGNGVKLVDRLEFSRANFAMDKGFAK